MLQVIGLTSEEEEAYTWLLGRGPVDVTELADQLTGRSHADDSVANVIDLVARLQAKGLVSRLPAPAGHVLACAPEGTLERLALRHEEALHRARLTISELQDKYRLGQAAGQTQELVEIVYGREAAAARGRILMESARDELRGIDKPPYFVDDSDDPSPAEMELLARGVRCRGIYDRSSLEEPGYLKQIEKLVAAGEEARVLDNAPVKLFIADRQLACVPLDSQVINRSAQLFIRSCALLDALVDLFESAWERAVPLALSGRPVACDDDGPTDDERRLLALLAGGLPDDAIGRALCISHRTLRRRLHSLQQRLRAPTRFQLALHAARRGWL